MHTLGNKNIVCTKMLRFQTNQQDKWSAMKRDLDCMQTPYAIYPTISIGKKGRRQRRSLLNRAAARSAGNGPFRRLREFELRSSCWKALAFSLYRGPANPAPDPSRIHVRSAAEEFGTSFWFLGQKVMSKTRPKFEPIFSCFWVPFWELFGPYFG